MRPVQPCCDYNNALVNCGYYGIGGYARAQSMTTCLSVLYDAHQTSIARSYLAISSVSEPPALAGKGEWW